MNKSARIMSNIEEIKEDPEMRLTLANPNLGIAFGDKLFLEFKTRGWLRLETFGALGTTLFAIQIPAFDKTHFAFISWNNDDLAFTVGQQTQ